MLKIVTTIEVSTERERGRGEDVLSRLFLVKTSKSSLMAQGFTVCSCSSVRKGEREEGTHVVVSLDVLRRSHRRRDGSVPAVCEKHRVSRGWKEKEGDER